MSHPDNSTIERFVMGGLDDDEAFIAHVAVCEECSRKLQREAELEVSMLEVRQLASENGALEPAEAQVAPAQPAHGPRQLSRMSRAARAIGPVLAFAAAAAVALWAGHRRLTPQSASGEGAAVQVVSCPEGPKQLRCIAEAHRAGSRLEYPKGTPLADLGSEPGFSVYVEPRFSDGVDVDVDELLVKARADLKACSEQAIVTQDAPLQIGEIGLNFTIAPDGRVEETQTSVVLHAPRPVVDLDPPMERTDIVLSRCLRTTVYAFPFKRVARPVRMSFIAQYVWRE
jgi:hypothetical protein